MPTKTLRGNGECSSCGRLFSSWGRLQHHRAAEHAPKTSEDISRAPRSRPRNSNERRRREQHGERNTAVKSITELRGLRDMRTAISTHTRSTSRHKGTPYLEIMSLGMEKLRLETEQARLTKFRTRVERRLSEVRNLMEERLKMVQGENPAGNDSPNESTSGNRAQEDAPTTSRNWRTMRVEY